MHSGELRGRRRVAERDQGGHPQCHQQPLPRPLGGGRPHDEHPRAQHGPEPDDDGVGETEPALQGAGRGHQPAKRTSPTGSPPPSSGAELSSASTGASTPSRARAAAMTGGRARWPPSSIFSATARPSGRAAAKTPSAPSLAISPGTPSISRVTSRRVPPSH